MLLYDLGYGQFGPNADTFDVEQLNPIVADRDEKETTPAAALEAVKTASPNLTRLAAEGASSTDAYVACPLCAPSRSAIMTPRYPQRFGGYINRDIDKSCVPAPGRSIVPVQLLQKSGYRTAIKGKWHLAKLQGGMDPGSGQHTTRARLRLLLRIQLLLRHLLRFTTRPTCSGNREKATPEGYITDQFTEEAVQFIRASNDEPFSCICPTTPCMAPTGNQRRRSI